MTPLDENKNSDDINKKDEVDSSLASATVHASEDGNLENHNEEEEEKCEQVNDKKPTRRVTNNIKHVEQQINNIEESEQRINNREQLEIQQQRQDQDDSGSSKNRQTLLNAFQLTIRKLRPKKKKEDEKVML